MSRRALALVPAAAALALAAWAVLAGRDGGAPAAPPTAPPAATAQDAGADLHAAAASGSAEAGDARVPVAPAAEEAAAPPGGAAGAAAPPPGPSVCVVRLVDGLGRPLPALALELKRLDGRGGWTQTTAETDAAARLMIPVTDVAMIGAVAAVEITATVDALERGARFGVPPDLPPGETDLGDVRLDAVPILAAGVVQNPEGVPVPEAEVVVQPVGSDAAGERTFGGGRILRTDARGAFAARGWAPGFRSVRVHASHRAAAPHDDVDVPLGSDDVVITLRSGGAIRMEVLADPGVPLHRVRVHLDPASRFVEPARVPPDGHLLLANLAPGPVDLEVHLEGDPRPLLALPGLAVVDRETLSPPELNPLDLRGRLRTTTARVVNAGGAPVDATVSYRASGAGDDDWATATHAPDAPAVLVHAADLVDVSAGVPGRGAAVRRGVAGDVLLRLDDAWEVELRLLPPPRLPAGRTLRAVLVPAGVGERPELVSSEAAFDADGVARLRVSRSGPYTVRWLVRTETTRGSMHLAGWVGDGDLAAEVDVPGPAAAAPPAIELAPPQAALDRWVESTPGW